jgi:hypothetical protein
MPKPRIAQTKPAQIGTPRTLPPSSEDDTYSEQIAKVEAIRRQHAARIIAAGLFSDEELWTDLASGLATPEAAASYAALDAILGQTQIPDPDRPGHMAFAIDVLTSHYTPYLDAGFLVGLAVGMQLGPAAFEGLTAGRTVKGGAR